MHLRNRVGSRVAAPLFLSLCALLILGAFASAQIGGSAPPPGSGGTSAPPPAPQSNPQQTAPPNQAPATTQTAPAQGTSNSQPGNSQPGVQGSAPAGTQAGSSQAQAPDANDNGVFVFRTEAKEVVLHATVVDDRNHLVMDLDKPDFTVFENDKPQQIKMFRKEDYPVAMGIVIDNSGSMREKRDEVNKAAINLVRSSNPDDAVFVVNFNDEYYLDQDFTSDIKKLQAALEHVETRGGTALYDAIIASADYLMKAKLQRKVLFVVTDGEDDASQSSLEQAVQRLAQENGPTVYTIGLLGDEKTRKAKRALQTIAERTGGIAFFPPTLEEVDQISRTVAHDIRSQYTISYAPSTPKSVAGYRTIHVDAHARPYKHLTVRTRAGYYPGQEQAMK